MIDLFTVFVFVSGAVAGGIAALKIIAPRTKTKVDDKALKALEKAQDVIDIVGPHVPGPKAPPAPTRPKDRDHR